MRKTTWVLTLVLWAVICAFTAQRVFEIKEKLINIEKTAIETEGITKCALAKQEAYKLGINQGTAAFQQALIEAVKDGKVTSIEIKLSEEETIMFERQVEKPVKKKVIKTN